MECKIDLDALKQFLINGGVIFLGTKKAEIAGNLRWLLYETGIAELHNWVHTYFDKYGEWKGNDFGYPEGACAFVHIFEDEISWDVCSVKNSLICQKLEHDIVDFRELECLFHEEESVESDVAVSLSELYGFESRL